MTLYPTSVRATDYRYNKSSNLPKAQSTEVETKHDIRKSESLKIFQKITSVDQKAKFKTAYADQSNLTSNELKGLKSLQKRVAQGEIVIAQSDKSSKLCVLNKEQYLLSGIEHCKNNLEISLTDVNRLQKYVNANVEWLHEIFNTGEFWGHQDRIRASSLDKGCQAAPLKLLFKDHKKWDVSSGKPIPSRPVVNGRAGYNCHLSEILSMILAPVAKNACGSEIESTGDLLSRIQAINEKLSQVKSNSEVSSSPTNFLNDDSGDNFCEFCQKCNKDPPTDKEVREAKEFVAKVSAKKVNTAMNVSSSLRLKLKASRMATKMYHRACVGQKNADGLLDDQEDQENEFFTDEQMNEQEHHHHHPHHHQNGEFIPSSSSFQEFQKSRDDSNQLYCDLENKSVRDINMSNGLMISGFDVCSLYPSLRDIDTACLARE